VIVIVFGVSGAGKTTIGKLLAEELGWHFYEGDDFHPRENIDKLRRGIPLTDEDRWPWLESLRQLIKRSLEAGENADVAPVGNPLTLKFTEPVNPFKAAALTV